MVKKLTSLLGIALFIFLCYTAFLLSWPYYKAWQYESDARDIVRFTFRNPDDLKKRLYESGQETGVPVMDNQIFVTEDDEGEFKAKVSWTETVDFYGYYQKTYEFQFDVGGKELGRKR